MSTKRRDFIRTLSLTSVTIAPGMKVIAGLFGNADQVDTSHFIHEAFRIVNYQNLFSADFYFINVSKAIGSNNLLRKVNPAYRESYMVVRLPQQHIAEKYVAAVELKNDLPSFYATTYISGYSYLVFKILFDQISPDSSKQLFPVSEESLLNWNAPWLKLVIRQNLQQSIFKLKYDKTDDRYDDAAAEKFNLENHYPLGYREGAGPRLTYNRENFPKVQSKRGKNVNDPSPVTAIEAPYKLILCPQLPDQDNYQFKWTFSYPTKDRPASIGCDGNELWMATLIAEKVGTKKRTQALNRTNPSQDLPLEQENEGDSLLRLMMIGNGDNTMAGLLPTDQDKKDLVNLYINYKLTARTPKISLTPLGICTNIEFKNKHFEITTLNDGISLYEWKQSMSFGRDQKVEVSHVVVESCFGLKMLHICKTKRETFKGASVLVYREYLMPLELEKDYTLYDNNENTDRYNNANWKCNTPFKHVAFADTEAKQIMPLANLTEFVVPENNLSAAPGCDASNVLAFWALTTENNFLEWPFRVTDWHGKEHICKKKIFVYTSKLTVPSKEQDNVQVPPLEFLPQEAIDKIFLEDMAEADRANVMRSNTTTSIPDLEAKIEGKLRELTTAATTKWEKILRVAEEFDLKKLDYYTRHLEAILESIESKIRSQARNIEDQAIEEWNVFKLRLLEHEQKVFKIIDDVLLKIKLETQKLQTVMTQLERENLEKELNRRRDQIIIVLKERATDMLAKLSAELTAIRNTIETSIVAKLASNTQDIYVQLQRKYQQYANKIAEFEQYIAQGKSILIGFEQEYREFLEKLPGRFRDVVKNSIATEINNLRQCLSRIRILENEAKSRIEFARNKIGYAVYYVEEELEKLKTKLKNEFGEAWESKYNEIRRVYHDNINAAVSKFETEYIILKGNVRKIANAEAQKVLDFFNEYACFPQLHTAKVFVQSVNDLVNKDIPVKIKYAEDYIRNQVNDLVLDTKNNVSRVFAEVKADAKQHLKSAIREINKDLGGIVNPDLAADFISYVKDARKQVTDAANSVLNEVKQAEAEIKNTVESVTNQAEQVRKELENEVRQAIGDAQNEFNKYKGEFDEAVRDARNQVMLIGKEAKESFEKYRDFAKTEGQQFFKGLESKILGAIHLKDILGEGFELPKLDRKGNKVYYRFITDKLKPVNLSIFSFDNKGKNGAKANMVIYFEKPLNNSDYKSLTSLNNFSVGVFSNRVIVQFERLQIHSDQNTKNKVSVKISDVRFTQELAFLEALSKNIKIPGTGLSLNISPQEISVDFAYTVPGISGGAFTLTNLKFGVGIIVPLPIGARQSMSPIVARFGVNAPDDKFVVAAGIWGGRGHFVLETTPKYIRRVDAGLDFGGYLGLNLGIAKGEAFLMAGIRYIYFRDDFGDTGFELYATLSCGGSVTVFGFITISVVFLLCLKYQRFQGRTTLWGTASITYSIKIGFFRKSFSLTFSRRLHGSEGASQNQEIGYSPSHTDGHYKPYNVASIETVPNQERWYRSDGDYDSTSRPTKRPLRESYNPEQWKRMVMSYKFRTNYKC